MRRSSGTIRKAADPPRTPLAMHLGLAQPVISRPERQRDRLLSVLPGCSKAAGAHPRIVVTVKGYHVEWDLAALAR
jgi:hypothetical protein